MRRVFGYLMPIVAFVLIAGLATSCKKKQAALEVEVDKKATTEKAPAPAAPEAPAAAPVEEKATPEAAKEAAPAEAPAAGAPAEAEKPAGEQVAPPPEPVAEAAKNENHLGRTFALPAVMLISDVLKDPKYYKEMENVKIAGNILAIQDHFALIGHELEGVTSAMMVRMQDGIPLPWEVGTLVMVEGKLMPRKWELAAVAKSGYVPPQGEAFKMNDAYLLIADAAEKVR